MPIISILKKINRVFRQYKNKPHVYQYLKYYEQLNIQKDVVLIESTHGRNLSGHLFYITRELVENLSHLKIFVVARDVSSMCHFLERKNLRNVQVVEHLSREYSKMLASAEYLLNDTTFYPFFIKKEGQKYINTWHGTPLKSLGQDMESITDAANVQRNFYMADKIIVSNDLLVKVLADSHALNGIYQGKMVTAPSPRNSILLDRGVREEIRTDLGLIDKKVYFYMPTWRGKVGGIDTNQDQIISDLHAISDSLTDDEHFFVKLHPFQNDIDLNQWSNIHAMPDHFEVYEFLTSVDVLITDYSSIMYDFSLTNREIILYMYDKADYFSTRGVYDDVDRYPFTQVETISDLISKMKSPDVNINYAAMREEFCPLDCQDGASIFCQYVFNNEIPKQVTEINLSNEKETVAILSGGFWDNGITTALLNTFDNIDTSKRNYLVFCEKGKLKKEFEFRVRNLDSNIRYYPVTGSINGSLIERFVYRQYLRSEKFNFKWMQNLMNRLFLAEIKRIFGDLKLDHFIHYTGFERKYAELIKHVPNDVNTIMYVHTDMIQEYEAKKNINKKVLFSAYERLDKIAVVHNNLKEGLIKELPIIKNKLHTMNNFLGEDRIKALAANNMEKTLKETAVEHGKDISYLISDLDHSETTVFINIGRYDYQKGHDRLLRAFESVYKQNQNTRLVIVAPHGPLREETLELATNSAASEGIYILGRMSNPYPLLAKCDVFVLSSHYEGLGLVVYEALAVETDVITVNLKETTEYLQNNEAMIVESSTEGLESGMQKYLLKSSTFNQFDFSLPKQKSEEEFEALFK